MDSFYVAQLQTTEGHGWTSVHKTQETAERRLVEKSLQWGYKGAYINMFGFADMDDCPGIRSYGVSFLPVED